VSAGREVVGPEQRRSGGSEVADKYAHLRPFKSRDCYREDGVPKKRYTYDEAEEQAGLQPGYHAYECPQCEWWHVGRDRE
jgi:hypothetical protein